MQVDEFAHPVPTKHNCLAALHQNLNSVPLSPQNWLEEICGEIRTALDELQVVQSTLCQPNEELVFKVEERPDISDSQLPVWRLGEKEEQLSATVSPNISGAIYQSACDRVHKRTAYLKNTFEQFQREIAQHKQVDEELEESLSLLRGTLEATTDGIIVSQNARTIAAFNQKFVHMWGISETVIASRDLNLVLPLMLEQLKNPNAFLCQAQDLLSQPDAEGYGTFELKDGRIFERYSLPQRIGETLVGRVCSFRDITERKRQEAALRESEERYRAVVEQTADGIFLVDVQTYRILEANIAYCNLLGLTKEEILQLTIYDIIPRDCQTTACNCNIQGILAEKQYFLSHSQHRRKDGFSVDVEVSVDLISYGGKEVFCFVVRDITERKQVEKALREKEEFLQLVLDNIPQFIFWKDRNSVYLGCNRNFAMVAGVNTPEKIVGKTDYDLAWKKEESDFFRECDARVMETDTPEYHIIEPQLQADGKQAWLDTNKIPLHDTEGQVVGILGTYEDITERKIVEKAIQQSEQKYRALFHNSLVGIFRNRMTDGAVLDANTAILEMFGFDSYEGVRSVDLYVHKSDREALKQQLLQKGFVENFETQVRRKDGSIFWVSYSGKLYAKEGYLEGVMIDITERKIAEAALKKANEELENRVEERTTLLRQVITSLSSANRQLQSEIEERTLAQEALRTTNQTLQTLIQASPLAIVTINGDGNVTMWNPAAKRLFGWSELEVLGRPLPIIPEDFYEEFCTQLQDELQGKEQTGLEIRRQRKDGSLIDVSLWSAPLFDGTGAVNGSMGLFVDLSERIQAELALRYSEARFREVARRESLLNCLASQIRNSLDLDTILETAVQEIYNQLEIDACLFAWYHPDGTPWGWDVVKEVKNPGIPSFLGLYPLESWRPFSCKLVNQEVFQVDNATECNCALGQTLGSFGTAAVLSLPIHTQSGTLGALTCGRLDSAQAWTDDELELLQAVANQLAIGINQAQLYEQSCMAATTAQTKATQLEAALHKLQQTQSQLIQTEKMSSLGQLVAGVAHEINNPLNFIHGNLTHVDQYTEDLLHLIQLYQEHDSHPVPEIQAETEAIDLDFIKEDLPKLLSSMRMGAERIHQIVLSLRNFSRAEQAEMKQMDIHEGLDSTLLILTHRLKAKPNHPVIQIIKEYGNLPKVQCYAGQLNQVFMNILSNAIDALEEIHSSWLMVQTLKDSLPLRYSHEQSTMNNEQAPTIWIHTEVSSFNQVLIRIVDNGPGMPETVKRRLFDPFFTTKPVGQGTGLGMSISYQIVVEKHGGQLQCISAPGQGTEFLIYLPIEQPPF
ncbi:MAG TPA: PAS domain S-box protein [Waterburya sp.]